MIRYVKQSPDRFHRVQINFSLDENTTHFLASRKQISQLFQQANLKSIDHYYSPYTAISMAKRYVVMYFPIADWKKAVSILRQFFQTWNIKLVDESLAPLPLKRRTTL